MGRESTVVPLSLRLCEEVQAIFRTNSTWAYRGQFAIRYPITIETQGKVTTDDTVEVLVPYKYLYLFDEPRTARITLEGPDNDDAPIVCPITSHNDKLLIVDGNHYFTAKTHIRSNGSNAQPELKVSARIVISDKTVWKQVSKK